MEKSELQELVKKLEDEMELIIEEESYRRFEMYEKMSKEYDGKPLLKLEGKRIK